MKGRATVIVLEPKGWNNCPQCGRYQPLFEDEPTHDLLCCDCLIARNPQGMQWWYLSYRLEGADQ